MDDNEFSKVLHKKRQHIYCSNDRTYEILSIQETRCSFNISIPIVTLEFSASVVLPTYSLKFNSPTELVQYVIYLPPNHPNFEIIASTSSWGKKQI